MNDTTQKILLFFKENNHKNECISICIFLTLTFYTFIFSHALYRTLVKIFYIVIIALAAKKKIKLIDLIDPITCLIACFFVIAVVSNLHNQQPIDESLQILKWFFPYILAKLLIQYDKMTPKRLAYFLCTAVTILALIGFMGDVFSLDSLFGKKIFHNNRFSFTMGGPNRAAFYLSASMLILMGLMVTRKKLCIRKDIFFAYIPMAFMLFSLILTAEKKSIFLLPLFVVLFVLFSKKYKILLLMLILGTSVLYTMDIPTRLHVSKLSKKSSTVSARLNAWKISSRLIEKKPIIGNGYASFRKKSGDYFKKNKATFSFQKYKPLYCAHNINLNTLVETGLLGLIAINAIFFISVITTFRSTTPKDFSFYIALIIVFIYLESQVGSFIRSFHRTNYTFLLMGICAGMYSKTYRGTWIKQFNQFQFFPKFLKGKGQTV